MQGRARIVGEEVLFEATRRWSYRTLPRVNEQQIVVVNAGDDASSPAIVEAEPYLDFDDWRRSLDQPTRTASRLPFSRCSRNSNQLIPRVLFRGGYRRRVVPPVQGARRTASRCAGS